VGHLFVQACATQAEKLVTFDVSCQIEQLNNCPRDQVAWHLDDSSSCGCNKLRATVVTQGPPTWFLPAKSPEELAAMQARTPLSAYKCTVQANTTYQLSSDQLRMARTGAAALFRMGMMGTEHTAPPSTEDRILFIITMVFAPKT
jgi:hypothetical protein